MAERLHPGVYIEEVSSGSRPIESVSTSTAAFLGQASRGRPNKPTLVTSMDQYTRTFGGHLRGEAGYLGLAVDAFFTAGGRRAWVLRVLPADAVSGTQQDQVKAQANSSLPLLQFTASGPGAWSDAVRIAIVDSRRSPGAAFDVEVRWTENGATRTVERFDDLVMDPESDRHVADVVNEESDYVRVTDLLDQAIQDAPTSPHIPASLPGFVISGASHSLHVDTTMNFRLTDGTGAPASTWSASFSKSDLNLAGEVTATTVFNKLTAKLTDKFTIEKSGNDVSVTVRELVKSTTALTLDGVANVAMDGAPAPELSFDGSTIELSGAASVDFAAMVSLVTTAVGNAGSVSDDGTTITITWNGAAAPGSANLPAKLLAVHSPGTEGVAVDSLDGLVLTAMESPNANFGKTLASLGIPARVRGYSMNNPANPAALPATNSDVTYRLLGGTDGTGDPNSSDYKSALTSLERTEINLLSMPGRSSAEDIVNGISHAERFDCFYLVDGVGAMDDDFEADPATARAFLEGLPNRSDNAALYYPWIEVADPVGVGRSPRRWQPPSGHIAGVIARTDISRGVWKAPAGLEATVSGALDLQYKVLDSEQDILNPVGVNCIRHFGAAGIVAWGARTISSDPEWRYVPVRRTALFLKRSLYQGLQWVVFEPNDEELWRRIKTNVDSFMLGLFRQGAFQGSTPNEAFLVQCDRTTNPQERVDQGIVTARVAFAPLKPAEFVVIELTQKTLVG